MESLDGILNAILLEGDQVFSQLGGDWEMELRGSHKNMESLKIKPLLGHIRNFESSHFPVVDSLKEGRDVVTDISQ